MFALFGFCCGNLDRDLGTENDVSIIGNYLKKKKDV